MLKKLSKEEAHVLGLQIFHNIEQHNDYDRFLSDFHQSSVFLLGLRTKKDRGAIGLKLLERVLAQNRIGQIHNYDFENYFKYIPEDQKVELAERIAHDYWGGNSVTTGLFCRKKDERQSQITKGAFVLGALSEEQQLYYTPKFFAEECSNAFYRSVGTLNDTQESIFSVFTDGGVKVSRVLLNRYLQEGRFDLLDSQLTFLLEKLPKEEAHDFAVKVFDAFERQALEPMSTYGQMAFFDVLQTEETRAASALTIIEDLLKEKKIYSSEGHFHRKLFNVLDDDQFMHYMKAFIETKVESNIHSCARSDLSDFLFSQRNPGEDRAQATNEKRFHQIGQCVEALLNEYLEQETIHTIFYDDLNALLCSLPLDHNNSSRKNEVGQKILDHYLYAGKLDDLEAVHSLLLDMIDTTYPRKVVDYCTDQSRIDSLPNTLDTFLKKLPEDEQKTIALNILEHYRRTENLTNIPLPVFKICLSSLTYEGVIDLVERTLTAGGLDDTTEIGKVFLEFHNEHQRVEGLIKDWSIEWKEKGVGPEVEDILAGTYTEATSYFAKKILFDWALNESIPVGRYNSLNLLRWCEITPENDPELWQKLRAATNFEEVLIRDLNTVTAVHVKKHQKDLFGIVGTAVRKGSLLAEVATDAHEYSAEMEAAGRVTFFHGQSSQWALYERVRRKMLERTFGKKVPETFRCLRYKDDDFFDHKTAQKVVKNGVTDFSAQRPKVLFTTLSLGGSRNGSNPLQYIAGDYDQSSWRGRNAQDFRILFEAWNESGNAYDTVCAKHPKLIEEIIKLHEEIYDFGNLITIDTPVEWADTLAYPTTSGGPLRPLRLDDGKLVTKISDIVAAPEKWPFMLELGIPLDRYKFATHFDAAHVNIVIREWSKARTEHLESLIEDLVRLVEEEKYGTKKAD